MEREAAFLFSYGVWQTVANDLSSGSFTESDLPCDLYYVYQVRAKVAGSAYGASKLVLGQAQSCTAGTSDGARAARSPSTPVRKLRLVTDRPTETSIRIRLLFHRNMDDDDTTFTPVSDMEEYRVDRTRPGPPITQTPVPADWIDPVANPKYRMERTVSEFDWTGLACGTHYWFRALGHGNGADFVHDWGNVWSNAVHGSTRGCTRLAAPVLDVIPLPQRRAELRWNPVTDAASYQVDIWDTQFIRSTEAWAPYKTNKSNKTSITISLDRIHKERGLFHQPTGFKFRVQAIHGSDSTKHSDYSEFTILDSPINSANGDAGDIPLVNRLGKIEVKWNRAGQAGDNVQYTLRWRKLTGDHAKVGWVAREWISSNTDSEYDWNSITTTDLKQTLGGLGSLLGTGIDKREVYALQLNYDVNGEKYFSGREAFAWSSHQAADRGERVATFPLNDHVSDKTYEYRICEDGFPADYLEDWKKLIKHALEQWEVATGLVTMTYVGATCADYSDAIANIADKFNVASGRELTPTELALLRDHLKTLDELTSAQTDDEEFNEIIMVNDIEGTYVHFRQVGIFPQFSKELGISQCVFLIRPRACAEPDDEHPEKGNITDNILPKSRFGMDPVSVPGGDETVDEGDVRFNKCPTGADFTFYETMVHEAGHALGIRDGGWDRDWVPSTAVHPTVGGSVMNYENRNLKARGAPAPYILPIEPNCSPHPLDILAIYALYQSR